MVVSGRYQRLHSLNPTTVLVELLLGCDNSLELCQILKKNGLDKWMN